jgi:tRNA-dihydrouridine synthase A
VHEAGCEVFVVHARNAWLDGLSPKDNREIPPLRYELVHRLKAEFPQLTIAINGGLKDDEAIEAQLAHVDGVMVGRQAYHEPWQLAGWDERFFGEAPNGLTREAVEESWLQYLDGLHAVGRPWAPAMKHALGLWNGTPGARRWRQVWSDHRLKPLPPRQVAAQATAARVGEQRAA